MSITARNITKTFGSYTALADVSLEVPSGKLVALLGPSGSGKTTLLRIIAGLEFADKDSGRIDFHGQDVTDVPAGKRGVGFVFQHYALFKHMTVAENIAFGLTVRPRKDRPSKAAITSPYCPIGSPAQQATRPKDVVSMASGQISTSSPRRRTVTTRSSFRALAKCRSQARMRSQDWKTVPASGCRASSTRHSGASAWTSAPEKLETSISDG